MSSMYCVFTFQYWWRGKIALLNRPRWVSIHINILILVIIPSTFYQAFTKFLGIFGNICEGKNRNPSAGTNTTVADIASPKERDKGKLFLSPAVSGKFLDEFKSIVKMK